MPESSTDTTITKTDFSKKLIRIDWVTKPTVSGGNSDSSSSSDTSSSDTSVWPVINWNKRDGWMWTDFSERLVVQAGKVGKSIEEVSLFPKVCYLYCELHEVSMLSPYDTEEYGFPFTVKELKDPFVWFTSPFGSRIPPCEGASNFHRGVDLATDKGTSFHAVHDGTIVDAGEKWDPKNTAIILDHGDGTYSRYLHGDIICKTGQTVKRGDVLGTVNCNGIGTGPHLHFEMSKGDAMTTQSNEDPLDYFPKLKGKVKKDDQIPAE